MKPSESIKPISFLKAHAAELIREISQSQQTLIITQNGRAKAILQDVHAYEQTQASLAMLKILALSAKNLKAGKLKPVHKAFADVEKRIVKSKLS